jgi:hypothetical protein
LEVTAPANDATFGGADPMSQLVNGAMSAFGVGKP